MLTLSEPRAARERPADLAEVSLPKNVAWIDLLRPEPDEVSFVKRTTGLDVPSIEDPARSKAQAAFSRSIL